MDIEEETVDRGLVREGRFVNGWLPFWSFRRHTKSRRTVGQVLGSTLAWTLAEFALICNVKKTYYTHKTITSETIYW